MSGEDEEFTTDVPVKQTADTGSRKVAFIDQADTDSDSFFSKTQQLSVSFTKSPRYWNDYPVVALTYDAYIGSAQYGFNHLRKTAFGHKFEMDDSPGTERVNIQHGNGSKIEMSADGNILIYGKNNLYQVVANDAGILVRGNVSITVESDADIHVRGDANMEVTGDLSTVVHGNHTHEVRGDYKLYVRGDHEHFTTGAVFRQTRGNLVDYNLSNRLTRTVGTETLEVGGDTKITTEGDTHFSGKGEIQSLFAGGLIDLQAGDINLHALFMIETHGEYVFVDTAVHSPIVKAGTVHGALEGTAKKATYATTAGVAGSGTPVPTTPSPESPEDPETAPTSEEIITDVTGTSDNLITNLDRYSITSMNVSVPDFEEVRSRARNRSLLSNSAWIGDILTNEVVKSSITSTGSYKIVDEASDVTKFFKVLKVVPFDYIPTSIRRATKLSENFTVANMTPRAVLEDQLGLSARDIFDHMQVLAMNVLEPLYLKYGQNFTIVEGLYNPYEDEKLDSNSFVIDKAKGLGVVIQFKSHDDDYLFEVANWIATAGVVAFDRLCLSYIDYDLSEENKTCLVITVAKTNRFQLSTEFNHQKIADKLLLVE